MDGVAYSQANKACSLRAVLGLLANAVWGVAVLSIGGVQCSWHAGRTAENQTGSQALAILIAMQMNTSFQSLLKGCGNGCMQWPDTYPGSLTSIQTMSTSSSSPRSRCNWMSRLEASATCCSNL